MSLLSSLVGILVLFVAAAVGLRVLGSPFSRAGILKWCFALLAIACVLSAIPGASLGWTRPVGSNDGANLGAIVALVIYVTLATIGAIAWRRRRDTEARRLLPRRRVLPRPDGEQTPEPRRDD